MEKSIYLCLAIALTGLTILHFTPETPYREIKIEEMNNECEGKVNVNGTVINTFYSEKGNYIGLISEKESQALLMLPEGKIFQGDQVEVKGRASEYREQCFIFPDETQIIPK